MLSKGVAVLVAIAVVVSLEEGLEDVVAHEGALSLARACGTVRLPSRLRCTVALK